MKASTAREALELLQELEKAYSLTRFKKEEEGTPRGGKSPAKAAAPKRSIPVEQSSSSDEAEGGASERAAAEEPQSKRQRKEDKQQPAPKPEPKLSRLVKGGRPPEPLPEVEKPAWVDKPPWDTPEGLQSTIGKRLRVFWGGDWKWYKGKITKVDEASHWVHVRYTDGEKKWHKMWEEYFEWLDAAPAKPAAPAPAPAPPPAPAYRSLGAASAPVAKAPAEAPARAAPSAADTSQKAKAKKSTPISISDQQKAKKPKIAQQTSSPQVSSAQKPEATATDKTAADAEGNKCFGVSSAPGWLEAQPSMCTCSAEPDGNREPCQDKCCINYTYFDGMRRCAFAKGKRGKHGLLSFAINDGMLTNDVVGADEGSPPLVSLFGGARKHRHDGRVEVLCMWFVGATDRQAPDWALTPLGQANREQYPNAPPNLLYRIHKERQANDQLQLDTADWLADWSTADAVLGKCRVRQVPSDGILRACSDAGEEKKDDYHFFYDSRVELDDGVLSLPYQLSARRAGAAGGGPC